ncbi:MAG: HAMP domain-containing sensor histidine kinase [Sandaracinus sp.]
MPTAVRTGRRRIGAGPSCELVTPEERYAATSERLLLEHGNQWMKQRPRFFWRTSAIHVVLTWAAGLSLGRLALVAAVHAFLQLHFVFLARRAHRVPFERHEILRTSLVMMASNGVIVAATGGLVSPFLPSIFATVVICASAFGAAAETRAMLAIFVALLVFLGVLPDALTGGPWPTEWYRIALIGSLAYSVWLAASKIIETTDVYVRAGTLAAAARDELLAARTERVNALEGMAARVAHDLKNPLAAIQGLTELLERQASDPRTAERLHVVNEECARMGVTIRDYLALSRPIEDVAPVTQPIGPIVDRVLTLFEARAATSDVRLVRAEGDAPADVDAPRLEEVLLNLVANAIEASPRGRTIEVGVRETQGGVAIEVRDHGRGMSPHVLARIGTPYFTTREEGTGLGVALSRTIVKQHGGTLSYESREGEGTLARIALPRARGETIPLAEAS